MSNIAADFCALVSKTPDMSNAAARFGAWLIGVAERTGGFPIETSMAKIIRGFTHNGIEIDGLGSRPETLRAAIDWFETHGYLTATPGRPAGFGYTTFLYSLHLPESAK